MGRWRGEYNKDFAPIKVLVLGTRKTCNNLIQICQLVARQNYCGNHPHNFYIQLFAETGFIGFIFGCMMFGYIIITCFKARQEMFKCPMAATAFVTPLGLFFPLQQFGSFYGQWGNLFIWFAIGFAMSQYQGWRNSKNYSVK